MALARDAKPILVLLLRVRLCADCVAESLEIDLATALNVLARMSRVIELREKPRGCEGCGHMTLTYHASDSR